MDCIISRKHDIIVSLIILTLHGHSAACNFGPRPGNTKAIIPSLQFSFAVQAATPLKIMLQKCYIVVPNVDAFCRCG